MVMKNGLRFRVWSTIAMMLVVAVSAAAMTATEAIKQRQEEMEGVKNGMMTLGAIAKKEQPFEAEVVRANAAKIADHLAKAAELFPAGSAEGEVQTWAKPEIWADREHFDEVFKSSHQAAVALQSVTEAEAFPAALGKLGMSCKSCHDLYRLPKN
jgi:cytochrome c556